MDLCGNWLLQNDFINTSCEIITERNAWGPCLFRSVINAAYPYIGGLKEHEWFLSFRRVGRVAGEKKEIVCNSLFLSSMSRGLNLRNVLRCWC